MTRGDQRAPAPRRRRGQRRLSLLGLGACVSVVAACSLLNPLDEYGPAEPRADATSPETSSVADDAGAASSCAHARWPERPTKGDAEGDVELVLALRTLDMGGAADGGTRPTTGFDLDNSCTCPEPPSCTPPMDSGASCDDDGGIDDMGTKMLLGLASLARSAINGTERLAAGKNGLVIRLAQYNGGMDDPQVELAIFPSLGTESDDAGARKLPVHDGNDRWTVDRVGLIGEIGPPYYPQYVDANAYVAGGWLVAHIAFPLYLGDIVMNLDAVIVARVSRDGSTYTLEDGRIAGRMPAGPFLTALGTIEDNLALDGGGLCGDSKLYADLKKRICGATDLVADPQKDNTGALCDALGMTLLFTAEQAQLGVVVDRGEVTYYCGESWSDDCSR